MENNTKKITIEVTAEQERFLKTFAERQKMGSEDNLMTSYPIHLVEEKVYDFIPFHDDVQYEIMGDVVYRCRHLYKDNRYRGWHEKIIDCLHEYSSRYPEKIPETILPVKDIEFYSLAESPTELRINKILAAYELDENDIEIAIRTYHWNLKNISFTLCEAKNFMRYQAHNLNEPRTYTISCSPNDQGDYKPFWDILMTMGTELLSPSSERY